MFDKIVSWLFDKLEKYPSLWFFAPIIVLFISLLSVLAALEYLLCRFLSV